MVIHMRIVAIGLSSTRRLQEGRKKKVASQYYDALKIVDLQVPADCRMINQPRTFEVHCMLPEIQRISERGAGN